MKFTLTDFGCRWSQCLTENSGLTCNKNYNRIKHALGSFSLQVRNFVLYSAFYEHRHSLPAEAISVTLSVLCLCRSMSFTSSLSTEGTGSPSNLLHKKFPAYIKTTCILPCS